MKFPFVSYEKYVALQKEYAELKSEFANLIKQYQIIVKTQSEKLADLENKGKFYVCIDGSGLESDNIYANDIIVFDDYFVFYNYGKVIAIMSKDGWKDIVTREEITE